MKFPLPFVVSLLLVQVARCADLSFEEGAAAHLRKITRDDTSGLAVLVARDGKIVFQGGFGFADVATKTPVTVETKFRIGSIAKQFTAAAIMRLAERGRLTLGDPLEKYFPGFPNGRKITLRQLLTHTSGLHSHTDKPDFLKRVLAPIEPAKLIAELSADAPDFAPGLGFHYNNTAYFLLGEVVAKVSGMPFGNYLRATFFEPLAMPDTGIFVNSAPPAGVAKGYSFSEGRLESALDWDMSWAGGAGALYSTVGDLFRWNEALFGGRVLNEASFKEATTPVELPPDVDGMRYGFGLVLFEIKRLPAIGHNGGLHGWSSDLLRLPGQHCTVAVLTNSMPPAPGHIPGEISHTLAAKLLAGEIEKLPQPTEDRTVDAKIFANYVGRYDYQGAILSVTVKGDALFAQLTGQPEHRIHPKGKDEFFWKVVDAQVAFLRDGKGAVIAARHTQNGSTFKAPKLAEDAVKLTPEQLAAYVGKYRYGPAAVMSITAESGQLYAQLTDQPKFPIFPKAENEFEWRVVVAKVRFVKGEGGKIAKAVHTQNGTTFDAPKIE